VEVQEVGVVMVFCMRVTAAVLCVCEVYVYMYRIYRRR
jgi:hypothetical protein